MRVSFSVAILCAAAAGLALPVSGQNEVTSSIIGAANKPTPVARLPYTAEYKITHVQTLASGATITQESTEVIAIDSQGRRMTSITPVPSSAESAPVTRVNIFDPVARTTSTWVVPGQKASVVAMPVPGAPRSGCATTATAPARLPHVSQTQPERPKPIIEDLGTQTINGVEARGRRITSTTPVGAIGNDAPLVSTTETWTATAPGLRGLVPRNVVDNPQSGKMTMELTNFTQTEPDPSVFQPPQGYEIVNVNRPAPNSVCPGVEGTDPNMAPIAAPPPPPAQ
jgi:hypothetical protein